MGVTDLGSLFVRISIDLTEVKLSENMVVMPSRNINKIPKNVIIRAFFTTIQ